MPKEKIDFVISVIAASIFMLLLIVAAAMLFRIYLKRKNRLLLEKERMSVEFEQTLLRSKLEIQEETFTHISHEIHDNIGQVLSLVRINLNTLDGKADEEKMELMDQLIGKAITDLRNLSHSLDSDMIRKTGWVKAAERLLNDLHKSGSITVHFTTMENLPAIGTDKPIILFRMIQEIINNIIKHSRATEVRFNTSYTDKTIRVEIADNGRGFDTEQISQGAGLQHLITRARMIGAEIKLQSETGKGTNVTILINTTTND